MTITNAQNIIEDGTTGVYAVLDDGAERSFSSTAVQNDWLVSGNQTSVSSNLWSLIPAGAAVSDSIKGSAPNVYAIQNGEKDWVLSEQTYSASYAPYTTVSNQLIYVLPSGANIP
jgi:hypothetical protein